MQLGPLLPGRIPLSLAATRTQAGILQATGDLVRLQQQLSTQHKFGLSSESPAAAQHTIQLQSLLERKQQAIASVQTSTSFLSATESSLDAVSDTLNSAKGLVLSGIGNTTSPAEKQALADDAAALIKQALVAGNSKFRDRYLFGGQSSAGAPPYTQLTDGTIRFTGDRQNTTSLIDLSETISNNVSGQSALGGLGTAITTDLNPALTLSTRIADLQNGQGVALQPISVTLDDGVNTVTRTVDLTGAETVQDLKTRLENAFVGQPITLAVVVDPTTSNGLQLTPSSGTVAVSDVGGGRTAANLGIASSAIAVLHGGDLNPALTIHSTLSSLNGGAGVNLAGGLRIVNGQKVSTVSLAGANTVQDVFNLIQQADPDVEVGLNSAGNGLAITTRISGADFSIGENGGTTATGLGIRTLTSTSLLSDLDRGRGVPVDGGQKLSVQRRDGSSIDIDLSGSLTVQDVLNKINAVDPGNLVASLVSTGNGIQLTDNSGTGNLVVANNAVSTALGLNGTGAGPATALVGTDPNPQEAQGTLNLLIRLERALRSGDDRELQRLGPLLDSQINTVNQARGELGTRLQLLETTQTRLNAETTSIQEGLSSEFDVDYAEVATQLVNRQASLEALYKIAAQTLQTSLASYL